MIKVYEAWVEKNCESKYFFKAEDAENYLFREYVRLCGYDYENLAQDLKAILEEHVLDGFGAIFDIEVE